MDVLHGLIISRRDILCGNLIYKLDVIGDESKEHEQKG
jgi:hypothetical protein